LSVHQLSWTPSISDTRIMVHELSKQHSIFNQFIKEIRDEKIQKDRMRFRRNLERTGEILAYEISKTFDFVSEEITTSLGVAEIDVPATRPLICRLAHSSAPLCEPGYLCTKAFSTILIMQTLLLSLLIANKGGNFEIEVDYISSPNIDDRVIILVDPMLATGASVEMVYKQLVQKGNPSKVHIASLIATDIGINHVRSKLPSGITFWVGAIDKELTAQSYKELTAQSYIVPGLGDAGDLAYGGKS